jgi:hypothetical protein
VAGGAFGTAGLALAVIAGGLAMARLEAYHRMPVLVLVAWAAVVVSVAAGAVLVTRRVHTLALPMLARLVERGGHTREGWVQGAVAIDETSGGGLAALADRQVTAWLTEAGEGALRDPRRRATRSVAQGAVVLAVGFVLMAAAGPSGAPVRDFWQPVTVLRRAASPVTIAADRNDVDRGGSVQIRVSAPGRSAATLLVREPGTEWAARALDLDSAGVVTVLLGPLLSDRYVRATSGDKTSETLHLRVSLPLLLTDLELTARFPRYTERADEIVAVSVDTLRVPFGTDLRIRGRASVPLGAMAWVSTGDTVPLQHDRDAFAGTLRVTRSGRWTLDGRAARGGTALTDAPELVVVVVPDSVPVVQLPVPGTDTMAPLSLRQGLLVDVRDDYRVRRIELESWRVTRRGDTGAVVVDTLPVPEQGVQRALVSWVLDLNGRGFLPGDTAFYRARAIDNAPRPQVGMSRTYALRLPSMAELRREMRAASSEIRHGADSLVSRQRELARRVEDLAAERQRSADTEVSSESALPFDAVERAREVVEDEREVARRAEQMQQQLRELSEAAWNAGLTDPAFHEQLRELQDLLSRAISDELLQSLAELQRALDRLSPVAVEDALQRLADAADQLRAQLERGRELFERAAVEGALTTLAAEAEELAQREGEWSAGVEGRPAEDAAAEERGLAERTDVLRADMDETAAFVDSLGMVPDPVRSASGRAATAEALMKRAASQAQASDAASARQSGEQASDVLQQASRMLEQARDDMRSSWRAEVLAELDRALVEVADLARREEGLADRLRRGEAGPDVRGEQGAVREGVEQIAERLRAAAGKNALVPAQLGASLGMARQQMDDALGSVQRAQPIPAEAARSADAAVDALNAAVYAIARSRDDVAGSGSGSGLSEALERMAKAAEEQGAMNAEAGGLFPMMQAGGAELRQRLAELAAREQALAQELERIRAESDLSGMGELIDEAERLAGELEGGRLDQEVLDRQEQLFRRLLDAGRSLESEQLDERQERVSETARPGAARVPVNTGDTAGERFPYPGWEDLREHSPEERRLILEYFRRLNDARR